MVAELRNIPVQSRSAGRLHSLRVAAIEVLKEEGRDKFTTAMVAERAGCSIGTVYRYWEDKSAAFDDIWPERDTILETVAEILERPLPAVTASRERDREVLMLEAQARMVASAPMLPEEREALIERLGFNA